ncbi:MAG: right-handed parallel beta-helix repeat-containing protein, partial [Bacteroidota bacterium]
METVTVDGTTNVVSTQPASQPGSITWDVSNVTSDRSITATYAENYYQLSLSFPSTLGTVAVEQPATAPYPNYYKNGTVVTLRARTVDGYHFAGWTGVPADKVTTNPVDITMDSDKTISASFKLNVPLTIVVTTISDVVDPNDGKVSLREALNLTDANAGVDQISFNIVDGPGTGSKIIQLNQPLPPFKDAIMLDFTTQPGYAGVPLIVLELSGTYPNSNGLELGGDFLSWGYTPQRSIIRGLEIRNFPGAGLCIKNDNNIIQQNWIHNNGADGICIDDGNGNIVGNVLGGTVLTDGNRIYANGGSGITVNRELALIPPSGNSILGNLVYSNAAMGIDLGGDGVTPNRYPGGPTNPLVRPAQADFINFRVNYPTINIATIADSQPSRIEGYLLSWPNTKFHI